MKFSLFHETCTKRTSNSTSIGEKKISRVVTKGEEANEGIDLKEDEAEIEFESGVEEQMVDRDDARRRGN